MFQAVEHLIEAVAQEIEAPQIKRLQENRVHTGKVIMPAGFEHLANVEKHYYLWPCLVGKRLGRRFALETVPCGSSGQCLIIAEFRQAMPLNFSLLVRQFSAGEDFSLVGSRFSLTDKLAEFADLHAFSTEPKEAESFFQKPEIALQLKKLWPFSRLTSNAHFLRLTTKNLRPQDLEIAKWKNILQNFEAMAASIESLESQMS